MVGYDTQQRVTHVWSAVSFHSRPAHQWPVSPDMFDMVGGARVEVGQAGAEARADVTTEALGEASRAREEGSRPRAPEPPGEPHP